MGVRVHEGMDAGDRRGHACGPASSSRARSSRVLIADQLEAVAGDLETLLTKGFQELGVELGDQLGVEAGGQVVDRARAEAAEVVVVVAAGVISGRTGTVGGRQSMRRADGDQGFQCFVNRGQADLGDPGLDGMEDLLGRRMMDRAAELVVDRQALGRAPQAGVLEGFAKRVMVEGGERRQAGGILSIGSCGAPGTARGCVTMTCPDLPFTLFGRLTALSTP